MSRPSPRVDRDDGDAGLVGERDHLRAVEDDRAARLDARARARAPRRCVRIVSGPTAGRSKRRSWVGLRHLHDARCRRSRAARRAGWSRRCPRCPRRPSPSPPRTTTLWPMSKRPITLTDLEAEADVVPLLGGRRARAEHARGRHDLVEVQRRLDDRDALALELGGERRAAAGRRAACPMRADRGERARVGPDLAEEPRLRDAADHDGPVDAARCSASMMRLSSPGCTQVMRVHVRARARASVSPRCATATTSTPRRRAVSANSTGKRPLPAISPIALAALMRHTPPRRRRPTKSHAAARPRARWPNAAARARDRLARGRRRRAKSEPVGALEGADGRRGAKPRRRSPTRFRPRSRARSPATVQNGGTSDRHHRAGGAERRLADAHELVHAGEAADDARSRRSRTCPPSAAPLARTTWSPTLRSRAPTCADTMRRQPLPMRVTMPPPAVPGLIDANSRTMLSSPISSVLGSPRYLRSCGGSRRSRTGRCGCARRSSCGPSTTACGADRSVPAPMRTCGPIDGVGADADAAAELGAARDDGGRMDARRRSGGRSGELDLGDQRRRRAWRRRAAATAAPPATPCTSRSSTSPGRTGRRKRARSTPTSRSDVVLARRARRAELRQRLAEEDARDDRRARESGPTKYGSFGADELHADGADARLDLEDAVDERAREPARADGASRL